MRGNRVLLSGFRTTVPRMLLPVPQDRHNTHEVSFCSDIITQFKVAAGMMMHFHVLACTPYGNVITVVLTATSIFTMEAAAFS